MSITIYRNPDGSVGVRNPTTGNLMVAPTQEEFEECCCGPCVNCGGETEQPSIVGSVAGGPCDAECANASATVPFDEFLPYPPYLGNCAWYWTEVIGDGGAGTTYAEHIITYVEDTGKYWAYAWFAGDDYIIDWGGTGNPGWAYDYSKDVTGLVACDPETGFLAGAYSLDGLDTGSKDCTGCTLEVTLGG